jgi:transcriptional regulator with XRE-family HTH domain
LTFATVAFILRHMAAKKHPTFRAWLQSELDRQGVSRREVARRLAAQHPKGVTLETVETYRRAIVRYLDPERPTVPNVQTRRAFAEALGVPFSEIPEADDEEDEQDMDATLQAIAREQADLTKRLNGLLKAKQRG